MPSISTPVGRWFTVAVIAMSAAPISNSMSTPVSARWWHNGISSLRKFGGGWPPARLPGHRLSAIFAGGDQRPPAVVQRAGSDAVRLATAFRDVHHVRGTLLVEMRQRVEPRTPTTRLLVDDGDRAQIRRRPAAGRWSPRTVTAFITRSAICFLRSPRGRPGSASLDRRKARLVPQQCQPRQSL